MIPGYVSSGCVPFCCPCWMNEVMPQKSGKSLLKLDVWVTGYAEGVNMGEVDLKVIHRGDTYLIAQIVYPAEARMNRCVVISEIEFEWVQRFCPMLWEQNPPERLGPCAASITAYLDAVFRPENEWRSDLPEKP